MLLLEVQVADIHEDLIEIDEDITNIDEDVTELEGDVNFLFDEQVIQDERLFQLETTSDQVTVELAEVKVNLGGK